MGVFLGFEHVDRHLVRVFWQFRSTRPASAGVLNSVITVIPAKAGIQVSQRDAGLQLAKTVAGGSPAATYFLCFAKESKQRKATPELPPLSGFSALLETAGRLRNSWLEQATSQTGSIVLATQTVLADNSPLLLRCSTATMGTRVACYQPSPDLVRGPSSTAMSLDSRLRGNDGVCLGSSQGTGSP